MAARRGKTTVDKLNIAPRFHVSVVVCGSKGGGGITCIIEDGEVFERGAVNISVVSGTLPPSAVAQMRNRYLTVLQLLN